MRQRLAFSFAYVLCFGFFTSHSFAQSNLNISAPTFLGNTSGGNVTVNVYIPGINPQCLNVTGCTASPVKGSNVDQASIPVKIPAKINGVATTAAQKAQLMVNAINSVYGAPPNVAQVGTSAGGTPQVQIPAAKSTLAFGADKTGENGQGAASVTIPDNTQVIIGHLGALSGVDDLGDISSFTASLGYDGLTTDTASFFYNQLATPTVDDLVTQTYDELLAGLPPTLQSDLTLNLPGDQIVFDVPNGSTNVFMTNTTTDTGVELNGGLSPLVLPEPGSMLLVGTGLLALAVSSSRRALAFSHRRMSLN
jgi:hypothetical protein